MGYDYSGYGRSTGSPSVASTLNDISACLEWLYAAGKQPSDLVLYGQSVGSGPSVYLAAVSDPVGGLILHSALASGVSQQPPEMCPNPSVGHGRVASCPAEAGYLDIQRHLAHVRLQQARCSCPAASHGVGRADPCFCMQGCGC